MALIPDLTAIGETLTKIALIFTFIGAAAYGLYKGVKTAKERGAKDERERQAFITSEVERQVTAHAKSYEERIAILKEALAAVQIVADFTGKRLAYQEEELREHKNEIGELRSEIKRLSGEHAAAVSRAFELQGQLDSIKKERA
jgi:chromosome segregation ATPase